MKNVFAAMVLVLLFVGSAAAFPCGSKHGAGGFGRNCGAPATSESKGQIIELRNLSEELRVELRKPVPDKVKAKALHGKILDIKKSIADARFNECLANPAPKSGAGRVDAGATPEMKAKIAEVEKLRDEFRTEMSKTTPDKSKVLALHGGMKKLNREMSEARFEFMLKNPEKYRDSPMFMNNGYGRGCLFCR